MSHSAGETFYCGTQDILLNIIPCFYQYLFKMCIAFAGSFPKYCPHTIAQRVRIGRGEGHLFLSIKWDWDLYTTIELSELCVTLLGIFEKSF